MKFNRCNTNTISRIYRYSIVIQFWIIHTIDNIVPYIYFFAVTFDHIADVLFLKFDFLKRIQFIEMKTTLAVETYDREVIFIHIYNQVTVVFSIINYI